MFLDPHLNPRVPFGHGGCFYGVYCALVTDLDDPDGQGRVRIKLPFAPDGDGLSYEVWARLATMMAGSNRGTWFIPDVEDEVLVAFEGGDPRRPYVVGALWNGVDAPPESMDSNGDNHLKVIRSRNGVRVEFNDQDGEESLTLETPGGQKMVLHDGPNGVEVEDANGNSITLSSDGINITSSGKVTVDASTVEVNAGSVTVNSGMSTFSGVVKADTVIATSVVGTTYTPGAGNIW